jgi:hypothetical protein
MRERIKLSTGFARRSRISGCASVGIAHYQEVCYIHDIEAGPLEKDLNESEHGFGALSGCLYDRDG